MKLPTTLLRLGSLVLVELAAAALPLQAANPTTRPATAPATQPQDPDVTAGREQAKRDAAAGKFSFVLVVPETFILMDMSPSSENFYKRDYFRALLEDRYGIKTSMEVVLPGGSREAAFAAGYDEVILPAIEAKFGKEVLEKAWQEAGRTKDAARAEYLDKRKTATTQAATRPTTDRSSSLRK